MHKSVYVRARNTKEARKKIKKFHPGFTIVRMRVELKEYGVLLRKKK